jgi:ATP-binding cassette, subfamily B, bacterial AbcA/BmrA
MKKDNQGLKQFISFILSTNIPKFALFVGLIGSVITTIIGLSIPVLTKELVDGFSIESISWMLILAISAVFIFQAIIDGISIYMLAAVGQKIVARLRERMWLKFIRLPVSYFDKTNSGKSVSRIVNDTAVVKDLISQYFPQFISGIISIIGSIIILLVMDWKMTLMMLISVPVTIAFMVPLGRKMSKISRSLQDETAVFTGDIQQTLSEIRLMKSSTAEHYEAEKGIKGIGKLLLLGLKESKILALISPIMYSIIMAVVVIIIGYGGIRVANGTMSTGSLVAFLLYLFQIVMPITSFAMFFTQLQKAKGATERIIAILELDEETTEQGTTRIHQDISHQPIYFRNVSFAYNDKDMVLENITFTAYPGEMIALAGPSGAGKTTLFSLLERYYQPTKGDILIGDTSIQDLSLTDWRKQIGYVSQESAMVAGTIRENLTYGLENANEISDEKLWAVAAMAYADEFIADFPDQLNTKVGERGITLSGGQRQRINIARAFLRNPKILMMDEATASLDSQSEKVVQQALTRLMKGRTTFVIAHRLATIVDADKIIFIENGQLTGMGKHEELLEKHSLYREFAHQQLAD